MLKNINSMKVVLVAILFSIISLGPGCAQAGMGAQSIIGLGVLAYSLGVFDKGGGDGNHAPQILTITATPREITGGGATILTVVAIDTDEDDTLTYFWSTSDGTLEEPTSSSSTWIAPVGEAGRYYINISVTDGEDSVTGNVYVDVI